MNFWPRRAYSCSGHKGPLQAGDFESVSRVVDPYIEQNGKLRGVMVEARSFPVGTILPRVCRICASFATITDLSLSWPQSQTARFFRLRRKSPNISSRLSFATSTRTIGRPPLRGYASDTINF